MRKSGRLASIHEDDPAPTNPSPTTTKKFSPTIPAVRRKKEVVEEDQQQDEKEVLEPRTNSRKPLHSRSAHNTTPSNVSGPLSLGPASMPRSGLSRSSNSSSSFSSPTIHALSRMALSSSQDSKPMNDSVTVEDEFAVERFTSDQLIKPVALVDVKNCDGVNFVDLETTEPGKLFLFQMPPILPTLAAHSSQTGTWPATAQGRYGKLRRYKSGKVVMVLENGVEFCVNPSIDADPHNTCVLAIDPEFAQSFNLGPIEAKFVCTPDFAKFQKLSIHQ